MLQLNRASYVAWPNGNSRLNEEATDEFVGGTRRANYPDQDDNRREAQIRLLHLEVFLLCW